MSKYSARDFRNMARLLLNDEYSFRMLDPASKMLNHLADEKDQIKQFIAYGSITDGYRFVGPFTPNQLKAFLENPKYAYIKNGIIKSDIITMHEPESM